MWQTHKDLNTRQLRFALGIIEGKTGEQAYVEAGYIARGDRARAAASRLLTNANVAEYVRKMRGDLQESTKITAELVVNELALIGLASGENAWSRFQMDMKMTDKIRALELLGKHLGHLRGRRQERQDLARGHAASR